MCSLLRSRPVVSRMLVAFVFLTAQIVRYFCIGTFALTSVLLFVLASGYGLSTLTQTHGVDYVLRYFVGRLLNTL